MNMKGLKEIENMFKDLPPVFKSNVVWRSMNKAADRVAKEMRSEFYSITGNYRMRQLIGKKGSRKSMRIFVKPYGKKAKRYGYPVNIGHLWTFGHQGIKGVYRQGSKHKEWKKDAWNRAYPMMINNLTKDMEKAFTQQLKADLKKAQRSHRKLL